MTGDGWTGKRWRAAAGDAGGKGTLGTRVTAAWAAQATGGAPDGRWAVGGWAAGRVRGGGRRRATPAAPRPRAPAADAGAKTKRGRARTVRARVSAAVLARLRCKRGRGRAGLALRACCGGHARSTQPQQRWARAEMRSLHAAARGGRDERSEKMLGREQA